MIEGVYLVFLLYIMLELSSSPPPLPCHPFLTRGWGGVLLALPCLISHKDLSRGNLGRSEYGYYEQST